MCHLPAQSVKNSYGHLGPAGTGAGGAQSTVPVPTTGTLAPGSGPVPTPTGPAREPSGRTGDDLVGGATNSHGFQG